MHIQLSTQKPIKLFGIKIFIERDNPNVINVLRIILQKMFFRYSVNTSVNFYRKIKS